MLQLQHLSRKVVFAPFWDRTAEHGSANERIRFRADRSQESRGEPPGSPLVRFPAMGGYPYGPQGRQATSKRAGWCCMTTGGPGGHFAQSNPRLLRRPLSTRKYIIVNLQT